MTDDRDEEDKDNHNNDEDEDEDEEDKEEELSIVSDMVKRKCRNIRIMSIQHIRMITTPHVQDTIAPKGHGMIAVGGIEVGGTVA